MYEADYSKEFKWNLCFYALLCVWAERVFLGSAKTAFKFKYEIKVVQLHKVERKEGA